MTLSDKIMGQDRRDSPYLDWLPVEDVKEFIKKLKDRLLHVRTGEICFEIDKLAGKKLI